jgi:predicted anti-sigma-YlaC factor YlaD
MGVDCRKLAELLIDFVSGECAEETRLHIEEHLGHCPPCVIYVETYRLTIQMTRKLPPVPMPPQLADRLWRVVETECRQGDRPRA